VVEVDCFELCGDIGRGGLMEVVIAVDGASTTIGGVGNGCGVPSPMLQRPYKRSGWCVVAHRGRASAISGIE
jgi:hypothetical protein